MTPCVQGPCSNTSSTLSGLVVWPYRYVTDALWYLKTYKFSETSCWWFFFTPKMEKFKPLSVLMLLISASFGSFSVQCHFFFFCIGNSLKILKLLWHKHFFIWKGCVIEPSQAFKVINFKKLNHEWLIIDAACQKYWIYLFLWSFHYFVSVQDSLFLPCFQSSKALYIPKLWMRSHPI